MDQDLDVDSSDSQVK